MLYVDIQSLFRPIYPMVLLRPTSEMCIYYTDCHDVDEEMRTITHHGGDYNHAADAGITERFMDHAITYSGVWVASVKNKD